MTVDYLDSFEAHAIEDPSSIVDYQKVQTGGSSVVTECGGSPRWAQSDIITYKRNSCVPKKITYIW